MGESFPLVSVFWVPKEGCPFLPASLRLVDLGLSFGGSPCHIGNKGRLQNSEGLFTSGIAPCGFFRGSSRVLAVFLRGALFWLMFSGAPRLSYPLLDPPYWSCQSCNLLPKLACVVSFRVKLQSRVPKGAPSFLMAKAMLDSLPKTAEIESVFCIFEGGFQFSVCAKSVCWCLVPPDGFALPKSGPSASNEGTKVWANLRDGLGLAIEAIASAFWSPTGAPRVLEGMGRTGRVLDLLCSAIWVVRCNFYFQYFKSESDAQVKVSMEALAGSLPGWTAQMLAEI